MPLHLYGVIRADHPVPPDLSGVGPSPEAISTVSSGRLAVAVSPIPDETELTEEDAVRHLQVLVDLLRDGPVLPVRFGTVGPDAGAVIDEVLAPAADELEASLDAVDGMVELRVVVAADESKEIATVVGALPDLRSRAAAAATAPVGDRIALGETISEQLAERRRHRSEAIERRLAPLARAAQILSTEEPTTSRLAFLVPVADVEDFDSVVSDVFSDLGSGYEYEYIGPLPAVDFVQLGWPDRRSQGQWGWTGSPWSTGSDAGGAWGWRRAADTTGES
jgi:hypothetical protein